MDHVLRLARPDELQHAIAIDEAALATYTAAGLLISIPDEHPFVVAERESWRVALEEGGLYFASIDGAYVGFHAYGQIDGSGHLEQLSVLPEYGRRGLGAALLEHACELARSRGQRAVWLTTYDHMPWNRPFYQRHGFRAAPEAEWGAGIRTIIAAQREVLPAPAQRVAMVRQL